ncbi:MAG: glycogen synthase [Chloroflexi bacterium]|nr:glycogen synthase [Chloroflexota bacterium]
MKVLFVGAEAAPFIKSGGLGDVLGSLPLALKRIGADVRVLLPHYGMIDDYAYQITHGFSYQFTRASGTADILINHTERDGVSYYFMRTWPFFDEPYFYTDTDWDGQRFVFFSQAAMSFAWELGQGAHGEPWFPDIIHVNDWHTGLIPFLLQLSDGAWADVASVLTIHNMAYQGEMNGAHMDTAGIPPRIHHVLNALGKEGNMLAVGLAYADKINTVSPQHAIELHYPRFGEGLEGLIWARDVDFSGILNGIDMDLNDPATDPHIEYNYDVKNFREVRFHNKTALQGRLGLPLREDAPLIGIVSRLVEQKGIDFGVDALRRLCIDTDIQVIILGSGNKTLEHHVWKLGHDFHNKVRAVTYYDPILAQQIYAASDMFLIPSRYEPCGITQMMAMRYGSLPVVRETGGLIDTVENYDNGPADVGTGFRFLWEEADAVVGTIRWALDVYHNRRKAWERMQERGMRKDWAWENSAHQYVDLYEAALKKRRGK